MKKSMNLIALSLLIAFSSFSLSSNAGEKKTVKTSTSKVVWKGYKVTGEHEGTINLKSAFLTFEGDKLTGGEFIIDMTSITNSDLQGEYKGKLEGHLKSDDFFGVAKHPTAKLIIKNVKSTGKNTYEVSGDMTIKDKTNSISFKVTINGNKANAAIKIDRSKFDVRYGSPSFFDDLADKAIYDEFDLNAEIEF